LTPVETLAQSIAGIAPSATPGMLIPIAVGFAGNGTWLSYLLATVGMLFTAQCINEFASRSACPGSLYTFVSEGFGPRAGILTGWALMFAYVICGVACLAECAIYGQSLCMEFFHIQIPSQVAMVLSAALIGFVGYKNVKLSVALMLWLELISVGLILLVVIAAIIFPAGHLDFKIDMQQLTLQGVSFANVRQAIVMAIFGFVAFESAASLGTEAANPLQSIPRAIMRSVIFSGAFFVICSYAMVMSFHGSAEPLAKCATPLLALTAKLGMAPLGHLLDVGIMFSFFGAGLANLTAGARAIYKMSKNGLLPARFGQTHGVNGTPHLAVFTSTFISLVTAVILATLNCPLLDIVGWLGTLATFGFLYAYMVTSLSAARLLKSLNCLTPLKIFVVAASVLVLAGALFGSIYPAQPAPYCYLPFVFLAYMLTGLLACRKKTS
jgi:amino acid transporter